MNTQQPTIALVAGEASGDQLGGAVLNRLLQRYPDARFVGIGGDRMRAEGMETWWDYHELAVFGLFEVLRHFPRLYRLRRELRQRLIDLNPDIFIGIDAPDFNIGLEISLRKQAILTVHYVSPTVWAWREKRVHKMARAADLVLCLFPFEPPFYSGLDVTARYVGHPMADRIHNEPEPGPARERLGMSGNGSVVALLPGSRSSEVSKLAAPMIEAARILAEKKPGLRFVSAMANSRVRALFQQELNRTQNPPPMDLVDGRSRDVMACADVVLVASGTAAFETLLVNRPMVVCYRLADSTYALLKAARLVKTRFFSLPNILTGEELVPELIQKEANGSRLAEAALHWLDNPEHCAALQLRFRELHSQLRCNAGEQAATAIGELLDRSS